jgi:hypothetical protein
VLSFNLENKKDSHMQSNKNLNETAIKQALKDGYITKDEARHMLVIYLRQSNFTPMTHIIAQTRPASVSNYC